MHELLTIDVANPAATKVMTTHNALDWFNHFVIVGNGGHVWPLPAMIAHVCKQTQPMLGVLSEKQHGQKHDGLMSTVS